MNMKKINYSDDYWIDYQPKDDQSYEDYLIMIFKYKYQDQLSWQEIADIINNNWFSNTKKYSKDYYRRIYYKYRDQGLLYTSVEPEDSNEQNEVDEYIDLKKQSQRASDILIQTNAYIRRLSREDTIKEIGILAAENLSKMLPLISLKDDSSTPSIGVFNKSAILQLSDWHYGIDINNAYNIYNPDVVKKRLNSLLNQIVSIIYDEGISQLVIANLGDMIAGNIHLPLRLSSRVDVISQVMVVSELLAEFIYKLHKVVPIQYYSVIDNHSRIDPNKKDAIQLESLSRITDWFLKERFKDIDTIKINDNKFGPDIMTFDLCGYKFAGVHGDLDKIDKVIDNITLFTHQHYDVILSSHLHHWSLDESNETVVISNPSLMGTDEYAFKLRKNSFPAQNLIIVNEKNPVYKLCRIIVA